jgi:diacylglycerol kinase family enzyme
VEQPTFAVVVNPHTRLGSGAALADSALTALRAHGRVHVLETAGDGRDGERIASLLDATRPAVAVAAGGDGTAREVAEAVWRQPDRPALGFLPFGTGNNIARSLGLQSVRRHGPAAVERAVAAICSGQSVPIDLGAVGERCFLGSFAVGMDGAILAARNRWRARFGFGRGRGGYALYLASCAANLVRQRVVAARLHVDGVAEQRSIYDLVVTNTAIYAGEFRFDADDHHDDGRLDLQIVTGPLDYLRAFPTAWRRHVRRQRGEQVVAEPGLRRIEQLEIEFAESVASQLDGEEGPRADRFSARVVPHALRVCR